jgi:copper chaperone CopZ
MSGSDVIRFTCPVCNRRLQSQAHLAGRQTRCPNDFCGAVFTIPLPPVGEFASTQAPRAPDGGTNEPVVRPAARIEVTPRRLRRHVLAAGLASALCAVCVAAFVTWGINSRKGTSATAAPEVSGAFRTEIAAADAETRKSRSPNFDPNARLTLASQPAPSPSSSPRIEPDQTSSLAEPRAVLGAPSPQPVASAPGQTALQPAVTPAPNENAILAPRRTARVSNDGAWSVDHVTMKLLAGNYETDVHPGGFGGTYTIRPTTKSHLLLVTFELEALVPDPYSVTKLARLLERIQATINTKVSPGNVLDYLMGGVKLSSENQRKLGEAKNYQMFEMQTASLVDPTGKRFEPVWCNAPLPEMTLLYNAKGDLEHFSRHAQEFLPKHWAKTLRANGQVSVHSGGTFAGLLETKCRVDVSLLYDIPDSIDQNDLSLSLVEGAEPPEGASERETPRPRRPGMMAGPDRPSRTLQNGPRTRPRIIIRGQPAPVKLEDVYVTELGNPQDVIDSLANARPTAFRSGIERLQVVLVLEKPYWTIKPDVIVSVFNQGRKVGLKPVQNYGHFARQKPQVEAGVLVGDIFDFAISPQSGAFPDGMYQMEVTHGKTRKLIALVNWTIGPGAGVVTDERADLVQKAAAAIDFRGQSSRGMMPLNGTTSGLPRDDMGPAQKVTIRLEGVHCEDCAASLARAVDSLPGVRQLGEPGRGVSIFSVVLDTTKSDVGSLARAIARARKPHDVGRVPDVYLVLPVKEDRVHIVDDAARAIQSLERMQLRGIVAGESILNLNEPEFRLRLDGRGGARLNEIKRALRSYLKPEGSGDGAFGHPRR